MPSTRRLTALAAVAALLALPACGGGGSGDDANAKNLTVWTTDTLPDRVAKTEAILNDFTKETGIKVKLVGVAEDQFTQTLTSAAAAGDLPDVIGSISLASVRTLAADDLVDTEASQAVVDSLGEETFSQTALELTRDGEEQLAVPSDSWSQLMVYRKDLFEKAGLAPPETYEDVLAAAKELHSDQTAGFVGPTEPADVFTQQVFEQIALANGCELVNNAGDVTLDSPQCVEAFDFYNQLVTNYSIPGAQDVDTVRAAYFSGKAAMIPWSTFILDEMAGLRNDALPTCPECRQDPAYLAKNSGFVSALQGPSGAEPAQYGEVTSWAIPTGGATESAQKFVEFMMTDGYERWTAIAPEGKLPVRLGTQSDPTQYIDNWETLPMGVDKKAPASKFYSDDVLEVLSTGPDQFDRWGITQGQGDLVGAILGELPAPKSIAAMTGGETDPKGAAEDAARRVRSIQDSLS